MFNSCSEEVPFEFNCEIKITMQTERDRIEVVSKIDTFHNFFPDF